MLPLYQDPHFTFRFAEDRIIPRFHLEGAQAGQRVSVFQIDPISGTRPALLATATMGGGGWVDLSEPMRADRSCAASAEGTGPAS